MKTSEVRELPAGTVIYQAIFEVDGWAGTVRAEVREVTIREHKYMAGVRFAALSFRWRGVEEWRAVSPKCCYRERYQAEREVNARLNGLRDKLAQMSKVGMMQ